MENSEKPVKVNSDGLNSGLFGQKRRFAFILSVNNNPICVKRFNINKFNKEGLRSAEFYDTLKTIVQTIKDDLVAKSRIYLHFVSDTPMKLTGFINSVDEELAKVEGLDAEEEARLRESLVHTLSNDKIRGEVEFMNLKYMKRYLEHVVDTSRLVDTSKPESCMFRFQFIYDNHVVYETQWDGGVYPRHIRNSVDIYNSDAVYADKDSDRWTFTEYLTYHLNNGRENIAKNAVKAIIEVLDANTNELADYTFSEEYGDREFFFSTYNKAYVKGWRDAVAKKTRKYELDHYENMSPKALDYIDRNY